MFKKVVRLAVILGVVFWAGLLVAQPPFSFTELRGVVKEVRVEKASPKARFGFVTVLLDTEEGTVKVRLFPEWWKIEVPFEVGDEVKVKGWVPPRAAARGENLLVAAEVEDLKTGRVIVIRKGPGKPIWRNELRPRKFSGRIVAREVKPGVRRSQVKWLVIKVETSEGNVVSVRVSPLWLNEHPELEPGKTVEVTAWRPPFWKMNRVEDFMACEITLLDSGKTLKLRKCPKTAKEE